MSGDKCLAAAGTHTHVHADAHTHILTQASRFWNDGRGGSHWELF